MSFELRIEVIYEDIDLIVIEKPAGLLSYPIERHERHSAIQAIRKYWKARGTDSRNLYLLHRLDKETSGLMIFAKTSLARKFLQDEFENHTVTREYLAVTSGIPAKPHGEIRTFLGRDFRGKRAVTHKGREAVTHYRVMRTQKEKALIRCRLQTGRTHQVRIHLAHLRTPVVGDPVYGKVAAARLALHANTLGFIHPRSRAPMVFRSSLPPAITNLLR